MGPQLWLKKNDVDVHLVFVSDETEWETPLWREWGELEGAPFALGDFHDVNAREVDLHSANLSFTNFASANLGGADLTCADLCKANFTGCDLQDADLTGADLSFASFIDADIRGACLSGVRLESTEFRNCVFDLSTELPFGMEAAMEMGMHLYDPKW